MKVFDDLDFELDGVAYRASFDHDGDAGRPWERYDGHGPMRYGSRDSKRPGERVCGERDRWRCCWLYDWQEAARLARRDGWNVAPYDAPNRVQRAVQADFDRLDGWLRDRWCYLVMRVDRVDGLGEAAFLGELESDAGDYLLEAARELARNVVAPSVLRERSAARGVRWGACSAELADGCGVAL